LFLSGVVDFVNEVLYSSYRTARRIRVVSPDADALLNLGAFQQRWILAQILALQLSWITADFPELLDERIALGVTSLRMGSFRGPDSILTRDPTLERHGIDRLPLWTSRKLVKTS
jgi:hypothetical protein